MKAWDAIVVNCLTCGRFVPRDDWEITHFEMSMEIASIEGQCTRCDKERPS